MVFGIIYVPQSSFHLKKVPNDEIQLKLCRPLPQPHKLSLLLVFFIRSDVVVCGLFEPINEDGIKSFFNIF